MKRDTTRSARAIRNKGSAGDALWSWLNKPTPPPPPLLPRSAASGAGASAEPADTAAEETAADESLAKSRRPRQHSRGSYTEDASRGRAPGIETSAQRH